MRAAGKACLYTLFCPFFCCYCCLMIPQAITPKCGNWRRQKHREKHSKMVILQIEKRERQHKRRNSLTSEPSTARKLGNYLRRRERWCDQESSTFFSKLPTEIRMHIYALVLNGKDHIYIDQNRWNERFEINCRLLDKHAHLFVDLDRATTKRKEDGNLDTIGKGRPQATDTEDLERKESRNTETTEAADGRPQVHNPSTTKGTQDRNGREPRRTKSLLPLLLTCRRVYAEAIPLLYSGNTFVTCVGHNLHYFPRSIPEVHRDRITSLVIYSPIGSGISWESTERTLLSFKNLKSCRIVIVEEEALLWPRSREHLRPESLNDVQSLYGIHCLPILRGIEETCLWDKITLTIDFWSAGMRIRVGGEDRRLQAREKLG
ncbi:uncharacterized protein CC84DRAFT_1161305 [Paraphaeosphaeria sporulosa]|uniref:DUF7730 domain-containing protein n=1 Tax=Paraphaeosphaeria sporulosa TaxID=1460663 RepID=A0A177CS41_9PLEO|nr:uncharacterized protein CC84DRAFT_1161305 [Paraphaeosphaeria sporulosa]OAG10345.1 hypothetical protein CC84DRAFT_1161305 [Paraphaeosphaeria sporulosa]